MGERKGPELTEGCTWLASAARRTCWPRGWTADLFATVHPSRARPLHAARGRRRDQPRGGRTIISASYLSQLRAGQRREPSHSRLVAIARFFGVDIDYFSAEVSAEDASRQTEVLTAMRDAGVRSIALRAYGLSESSLAAVLAVIENARRLESLPDGRRRRSVDGAPGVPPRSSGRQGCVCPLLDDLATSFAAVDRFSTRVTICLTHLLQQLPGQVRPPWLVRHPHGSPISLAALRGSHHAGVHPAGCRRARRSVLPRPLRCLRRRRHQRNDPIAFSPNSGCGTCQSRRASPSTASSWIRRR